MPPNKITHPAAAADGPIKVIRSDSDEDTTDNTRGPLINDFDVNGIVRPGLCLAVNTEPASSCLGSDCGYFGDTFNCQGINFSGAARMIKFGNETSSTTADNISIPIIIGNIVLILFLFILVSLVF